MLFYKDEGSSAPKLWDIIIGIAIGLFLSGYHFCYQTAAKMEKSASNLGILLNLRDVFIYLTDIFLLGNPLVLTNLIGAIMITASGLLIFFDKKSTKKSQ
jgi:drug/metabolite transporter (DMT)-like permease